MSMTTSNICVTKSTDYKQIQQDESSCGWPLRVHTDLYPPPYSKKKNISKKKKLSSKKKLRISKKKNSKKKSLTKYTD